MQIYRLKTWILDWILEYLNTWILEYFCIFMSDIVFFWNFVPGRRCCFCLCYKTKLLSTCGHWPLAIITALDSDVFKSSKTWTETCTCNLRMFSPFCTGWTGCTHTAMTVDKFISWFKIKCHVPFFLWRCRKIITYFVYHNSSTSPMSPIVSINRQA